MKRLYSFPILCIGLMFLTNIYAQTSGFRFETVSEPGIEKNGQTIYANGTSEQVAVYMIMKNVSGDSKVFSWERVRMNLTTPNSTDELCDNWQCYTPSLSGDNWTLGNTLNLGNGQQTAFDPKITFPEGSGGSSTFRYYVLNEANQRIDSVTIVFNSTLSISASTTAKDTKVYPNPSNGQITIKDAVVGSELEIVDMVGKVIFKTTLSGVNQNFDLSSNPDGVYFYTIKSADGGKSVTKKLVLRR